MKKMLVALTAFLIIGMVSQSALALWYQECRVRYMTLQGWSQWYKLDVSFATGQELSKRTGQMFRFSFLRNYAVIWFGVGEHSKEPMCAIVELDGLWMTGLEFKESDIKFRLGNAKGKDENGVEWEICHAMICL